MAETKQPSAEQVAARALSQKSYKKLKKKRARAKQAEKRQREKGQIESNAQDEAPKQAAPLEHAAAPANWHRVAPGDENCPKKGTNRSVDDDKINVLLEKRSQAKTEKNYTVSDEITRTLVDDMEIFYNDEKRQWHTRLLLTVEQKEAKKEQAKKRARGNDQQEPSPKKSKNTKK